MRPETVRRVAPPAAALLVLLVIGAVWAVLSFGHDGTGAQPGGGGAGSSGNSAGSAGTGSAAPGGPATGVPAEGSRFSSVTRAADDRSLEVAFYGGVPECYSYAVRAAETSRQVRLTVVETRTAGDKPCIDLAMEITKTVPLDSPLGLRTVVDAASGTVVLGPSR
jgi:hypothetical protein